MRNEKSDKIDNGITSLKDRFQDYEKHTIYKSKIDDLYYFWLLV